MSDYGKKLITDLPDQFKGKSRIEALLEAIGRQLDEVYQFYDDLNLNRSIDTAVGKQLDMIGNILGMTRAEAGELIDDTEAVEDDENYRYVLKYKIAQNANMSTYYDIVRGLKLLFNVTSMTYSEKPEEPARITITMTGTDIENIVSSAWGTLMVKPAGVGVYFANRYDQNLNLYYGFVTLTVREMDLVSEDEDVTDIEYYVDEDENTLTDENGNILY